MSYGIHHTAAHTGHRHFRPDKALLAAVSQTLVLDRFHSEGLVPAVLSIALTWDLNLQPLCCKLSCLTSTFHNPFQGIAYVRGLGHVAITLRLSVNGVTERVIVVFW